MVTSFCICWLMSIEQYVCSVPNLVLVRGVNGTFGCSFLCSSFLYTTLIQSLTFIVCLFVWSSCRRGLWFSILATVVIKYVCMQGFLSRYVVKQLKFLDNLKKYTGTSGCTFTQAPANTGVL